MQMTKKELIKRLSRKMFGLSNVRGIKISDPTAMHSVGDLLIHRVDYTDRVDKYFIMGFCSKKSWWTEKWEKSYIVKVSYGGISPGFTTSHQIRFINRADLESMKLPKSLSTALKDL